MNRRNFARLSALTLAATRLPAFAQGPAQAITPAITPAPPTGEPLGPGEKPIGYAAVGLGTISGIFMRACAESKKAKITALVTGHPDTKGKQYAAAYGFPETSIYTYESFDRIRDNPAVDAVYIGLPNSMHREYTVRAAQAGKHVLCEKPMATNVADCERMIGACKAANVKLMIAYRCHYEPTNLRAAQLARSGALGQVQAIESAFGFNIAPGEWRLSKAMAGGGPLFDVGIYSLNACRYLTGEEPAHISAYASTIDHDGRFREVEENVAWTMKFPSGIVASCTTTYGANMAGYFRVYGAKGWLTVDNAFSYDGLRLRAFIDGKDIDEPNPARDPSHFQAEAEHFSHCVQNNQTPQSPGEEGLKDLQYITEIYRSAGIAI
jgi:predicted dehydrogenase